MRWFGLVLLCAVFVNVYAEPDPDPKKYNKAELKPKIRNSNSTLTDEEKQFLREVEAKFGIKSEVPLENKEKEEENSEKEDNFEEDESVKPPVTTKLPFPAVIAIEIVNDTDTKTKGKRTIDANLGYGYRTNSGYTYTYLGKPAQEHGKFMIYPYSQEDIPAASSTNSHSGYSQQSGKTIKISPNVEITPSQAFELVPTKDEEPTSYNYEKPAVQLNTKYENVHGVETPPPPYPGSTSQQTSYPSTLYTTYNGEQFSGLSGQFPKVMSNYLVAPSQLLNNPTYQSAGLTQDHLRPHGANLEQRVVPVLVLRVPSSYIKNPSAELYANLPQNYPLSQYLNNVNLQELVNQYFRKIGYPFAPKVMAYPTSPLAQVSSHAAETESVATPVSSYQPQHYATPYVQPSYTHADHSGVQYSAVQPVMARYPSGYTRQYYVTRPQTLYQQPLQQQQYVYRYKYVPQPPAQSYYSHQTQYHQEVEHRPHYQQQVEHRPHYQQQVEHGAQYQQQEQHQPQYQQEEEHETQYQQEPEQQTQYQQEVEEEHAGHGNVEQPSGHDTSNQHEYQSSSGEKEHDTSSGYNYPRPQIQQEHQHEHVTEHNQHVTSSYETASTATPSYDEGVSTPGYGSTKGPYSYLGTSQSVQIQYQQPEQKETIAIFPRSQTGHKAGVAQNYIYQKITNEHSGSESLVLTENYPSKDHTIATVLPLSYKKSQQTEPIQSVSYVTPTPTMKYHSHYRVMVPQTILRQPTDEKVSYVNSHSVPSGYSSLASSSQYQSNPDEYSVASHYVPAVSKQKIPTYSRNYAYLKRMTKPENKSDSPATTRKNERSEKNKSS